jgi:peptidoglycan/LPS O-acetylase OafA/YrhL
MQPTRISSLDGLRGIACLMVVFYHYLFRYGEIYNTYQFNYFKDFNAGVEIFFFISGFVIYMTLPKAKNTLHFFALRSIRLLPTYWVCLIISYSIITFFGLPGREVNLNEFLLNFLLFHQAFGIPNVDGVYWSLVVEFIFYFWIGVMYFFSKKYKLQIKYFFLLWLVLASIFYSDLDGLLYIFNKSLILEFIPSFICGIYFYKIMNEEKSLSNIIILIISYFAILVTNEFAVFIPLLLLPFFISSNSLSNFLSNNVLRFFGTISYPLYLVHQNIGYIVITFLINNGFEIFLSVFLALAISVLISIFVNKYFELSLSRKLKNIFRI